MSKKNQDERILFERRKIQSDAYQILIGCLMVSILIQQFVVHAPFAQFAVEFFCLIGIGGYVAVRHLALGIDIWNTDGQEKRKPIKSILGVVAGGIAFVVLTVVLTGEKDVWYLLVTFICVILCNFSLRTMASHISSKKEKAILDALENEED